MKKYSFSQIQKCTWQNTYDKSLLGKYFCQVFDEKGEYVKYLSGDSYKEVAQMQRDLLNSEVE